MFSYSSLKPLLFRLEPETAHSVAAFSMNLAGMCTPLSNVITEKLFISDKPLQQEIFGRTFYNPVGLAAGFDKNATLIKSMSMLGFGFTEIGTVTPKPQDGNPKPRLFRHIEEESLQNAMGFNNAGSLEASKQLQKSFPYVTPIGINIGKNKITPDDKSLDDYLDLIKTLQMLGDYIVINVSSPNTPGLRDLQNEEFISILFGEAKKLTAKPVLLKLAPDMTESDAVALAVNGVQAGADGIVATNTSIDYSLVKKPYDIGGISGAVIKEKSRIIFKAIANELFGKTTLISVGGIDSADEAWTRLKLGASLVQVYSALIFKGPTLIRDINLGLLELMKEHGVKNINEIIGSDIKWLNQHLPSYLQ